MAFKAWNAQAVWRPEADALENAKTVWSLLDIWRKHEKEIKGEEVANAGPTEFPIYKIW